MKTFSEKMPPGDRRVKTVLAAAKRLAYHPNRAARSLITGKTGNFGIIVPDLANPFYPGILRGVQVRAPPGGLRSAARR